ncbi:tetratricopeptide repeat protein [Chryseomicrobium palamuruense]|uniref:Tetratricopeptide repeat protein n=1 Tax=Chryseomicrobium palamuruense TaxID=682973 RepID=A0ABV8UZU0_9BACL
MTVTNEVQRAIALRAEKKYEESNELLKHLADTNLTDAYIQYQCAWSYDVLGEEAKAVPHYEAAIQGGLQEDDLQRAYLGLGSTYRALGEYQDSERIFEEALTKFPNHQALSTFYAMTLYNLGQHNQAIQLLLKTLIDTTSDQGVKDYAPALSFYAEHLDETWKS